MSCRRREMCSNKADRKMQRNTNSNFLILTLFTSECMRSHILTTSRCCRYEDKEFRDRSTHKRASDADAV